jgi:hypothetical protein
VALQAQPDERFVDLMSPEQQRQGSERDVVLPVVHMSQRIDPDGSDRDPADQISLR